MLPIMILINSCDLHCESVGKSQTVKQLVRTLDKLPSPWATCGWVCQGGIYRALPWGDGGMGGDRGQMLSITCVILEVFCSIDDGIVTDTPMVRS